MHSSDTYPSCGAGECGKHARPAIRRISSRSSCGAAAAAAATTAAGRQQQQRLHLQGLSQPHLHTHIVAWCLMRAWWHLCIVWHLCICKRCRLFLQFHVGVSTHCRQVQVGLGRSSIGQRQAAPCYACVDLSSLCRRCTRAGGYGVMPMPATAAG